MQKLLSVISILIIFQLLFISSIFSQKGYKRHDPRRKDRGVSIVIIDSTPSGAQVKIEEWKLLGKTPLRLWLPSGRYKFIISKKGFFDDIKEEILEAGTEMKINAVLKKGVIVNVLSNVSDTFFYLNNDLISKGTKTSFLIKPGNYEFRAKKKGFKNWERFLELYDSDDEIDLEVRLEQIQPSEKQIDIVKTVPVVLPEKKVSSVKIIQKKKGTNLKKYGWITLGSGIVLITGGAFTFNTAYSHYTDAKYADPAKENYLSYFNNEKSAYKNYELSSQILFSIGGTAVLTGIIMLIFDKTDP